MPMQRFPKGSSAPWPGLRRAASNPVRFLAPLLVAMSVVSGSSRISTPVYAGPNTDGSLILHVEKITQISRSDGARAVDQCGRSTLRDCAEATVTVEGDGSRLLVYLFAAFPGGGRVQGATFGIDYGGPPLSQNDVGTCADFELPSSDWPEPFSGNAVTFANPQSGRLIELAWFYVYAEYGGYFAAGDHPTQLSEFADDSIPSETDPVEHYGILGFGLIGENPCLEGVPTGACCRPDGSCLVTTEFSCEDQEGVYRGDDVVCDPYTCLGYCCIEEQCFANMTAEDCMRQGGTEFRAGYECGQTTCLRMDVSWGELKEVYR